jgi:hypothetical protein
VGNRPAMLTTEGDMTMLYVPITKDIVGPNLTDLDTGRRAPLN